MEKLETKPLTEIHKVVQLNAPLEKVWKAIATSDGIASWWMKNNFKPKIGYKFDLFYGDAPSPCKVTEIIPSSKLSFEWDKDWQITFELKELGPNKCELSLTHAGWDENKNTRFGQPHTVLRKVMYDGWTNMLQNRLPEQLEM